MDIESLWDYNDPTGSESLFLQTLGATADEADRLEIQTQIARTHSLRRQFDQAHAILDEVQNKVAEHPRAHVRYLLERGRTLNSSQNKTEAKALFIQAYELAAANHEEFLAADAAHMVAIVETGDASIEWNVKTIQIAQQASDPRAKKWVASAGNNLGWTFHDLGRYEDALAQFEVALEARKGGPFENYMIARWCVARSLRSLGRVEEALKEQRALESEWEEKNKPSGFVFEEIAECLYTQGHAEEARPYFAKAHAILSQDRWLVADSPERLTRLRELGAANE